VSTRLDASILLSINGLAMLALGILPQPLMQICLQAVKAF
jgi:NADH-quinone oxidoreductase subunit N